MKGLKIFTQARRKCEGIYP